MKKVIIGILAVAGLLSILGVLFVGMLGLLSMAGRERVPGRVVLEMDLESGIVEAVPEDPLAQLTMEQVLTLREAVDALDRAREDDRVKALVARLGGAGMGLAHLQELRDAVVRFRQSGKPAHAYAETFGEFGPGNGGYYLATAFDRIYLQPSGDVGLTGMIYETMFMRGALEKLDVSPRISQRYEYKNAANSYTETGYTEPHRQAMQELMDSQFRQLVAAIAQNRGLEPEQVKLLFDRGPYLGSEAVDAGLVDVLAYPDEFDVEIEQLVGEAERMGVQTYGRRAGSPHRRGTTIAFIQGYGAVVRGRSGYSPLDGSVTMGASTIAQAFRDAIDDRRVKAILFRVDSPGGSYVASDTIRRETLHAREAGKPVIVSMGNVAGSGGYFVAMDADRIVAQPGTITGSIGVYGGKLITRKFWENLGVTWDAVQTSAHSNMWSTSYDYGPAESRFQASLDRIYDDFTEKVAAARGLEMEEVLRIARGRIWTGEDALARGLVDELGGLDVALAAVRDELELDPDAPIKLKRFPKPRSPLELLLQRGEAGMAGAWATALSEVQPELRMLRKLGLRGDPGPLSMPEFEVAQ